MNGKCEVFMESQTYAVVDLETTGHSSKQGDRIIQIAIVFMKDWQVVDTYTKFVNPEQNIPSFIEDLTDISNADVAHALPFQDIAYDVYEKLQGTEKWWLLQEHSTTDQVYLDLQFLSREYNSFLAAKIKLKVQLSNLIERTFPGLEKILKGHYWALLLDFYELYPCASLVREMSEKKFSTKFIKLAAKKGHRKGAQIAQSIYQLAHECVTFEPNNQVAALSVKHCVTLLRSTEEATIDIITQMNELAKELPEYEVVKKMKGVGDKLAPRLIAEIGDVRRFKDSKSLIAYAGIDAPPYQSGQFEGTNRHISKRGSKSLRKCGYEVMMALKSSKPKEDNAVYEYMLKKEAEGKNKKLVKIAGLNKFLRMYYARVMEVYQN